MTIRTADDTLVVVGASLAGLRAVETARTEGFGGRVVVVGDEPHRPYDRPPLSKKLLSGEWDADRIQLRSPEVFDEIDAEWRFGTAATHLDAGGRKLSLDDGSELDFDALVIASGSRCRRLPDQPGYVHELRTLDDSLRLRDELAPGDRRVVVIGAGFIGLEVAATARQAGNEVTVLESADAPLIRGCGAEMGRLIGALHSAEGVEIRCGVFVEQLQPDGVLLRGGERVAADVIVVGIGVTPATEWLAGSDLVLRDGVVCDSALRVTRTDGSVDDSVCARETWRAGGTRCSPRRCASSTGRTPPSRARWRRRTCWQRGTGQRNTPRCRSSGATSSRTASSSSAGHLLATK